MTSSYSNQKSVLLISLAFSIIGFGFGFGLSYQEDRVHVREVGQMVWLHLRYAQRLKDDMGVIDWSKNLEKLEGVWAFQVKSDSHVTAEGGNETFLPRAATNGVSYLFPGKWVFRATDAIVGKSPVEFTLVYSVWPSPPLSGFILFLICFVTGITTSGFAGFLSPPKDIRTNPTAATAPSKNFLSPPQPQFSHPLKSEKPFLFLDKNYLIQQVTPEAALLLERTPDTLVNRHLFDLSPEPDLMRAIEKAEETKLLKPFLSYPHLSVSLKPDPNGTLLFLEKPK